MISPKKMGLIAVLAVILAIVSVYMFSPGLFVVKYIETASSMSTMLIYVLYGVIVIGCLGGMGFTFYYEPSEQKLTDLNSKEEFVELFTRFMTSSFLGKESTSFRKQVFILDEKIMTLDALLQQKFDGANASYSKFNSIIKNTQKLVYANFKNAAVMIKTFNEEDYKRFSTEMSEYSEKIVNEKMETFNIYKKEVKDILSQNEEILLKLDKLQLEVSRLSSTDNIEENAVVQEMNSLITQTKLYK